MNKNILKIKKCILKLKVIIFITNYPTHLIWYLNIIFIYLLIIVIF